MSLLINGNELEQIEILTQIGANSIAGIECFKPHKSILEYSSATYKKLFNTNPHPTALIRLSDGHLLEANQRFETLLGYTKDEFRQLGVEFFLQKDIKRIKQMARTALRGENWFETESYLQSQNKGLIPVVISASLLKHDEQTLVQTSIRVRQ